ncbi:MAG: hypothetical protein ACQESJ_07735 [Bacteroidota bacterium]
MSEQLQLQQAVAGKPDSALKTFQRLNKKREREREKVSRKQQRKYDLAF